MRVPANVNKGTRKKGEGSFSPAQGGAGAGEDDKDDLPAGNLNILTAISKQLEARSLKKAHAKALFFQSLYYFVFVIVFLALVSKPWYLFLVFV